MSEPQADVQTDPTAQRVALLGAGVMGETVLAGLLRSGRSHDLVTVVEKRADRAAELRERYAVRTASATEAVAGADVVALVTKPQDVPAVLAEVAGSMRAGQVLVSLAAGLTTASLAARVPDGVHVVRVMPNTPALVDEGMAVLSPGEGCSDEALAAAEALVSGTGRTMTVPEHLQDAVTAVSGSGPAYVFLVAEAMTEAGVLLGLPRAAAAELTVQTLVGASAMLRGTGENPALLREQVTSPGGTTAAALRQLEAHGLRAAFADALTAARDRSRELAGG